MQRATFRFDKLRSYDQLFFGEEDPDFAKEADSDEAFGYRRIAGPNSVALCRERDLKTLHVRIPFDCYVGPRVGRTARHDGRTKSRTLFSTRHPRTHIEKPFFLQILRPAIAPDHR